MIGDALADRDAARSGEQLRQVRLDRPLDRGHGAAMEGIADDLLEHRLLGHVDRRVDLLEDVCELAQTRWRDQHRAHADVGLERAPDEQRALADRVATEHGSPLDVAPGDARIDRCVVGEPRVADLRDMDHLSHLAR